MTKNDVRIKDNITIVDKIRAIEDIVSSYWTDGEYTPYYSDMATVIAIVENFITGVEFEEDDVIYDLVNSDEELSSLVYRFLKPTENDSKYREIMYFVLENVEDMVGFEKQKVIHNSNAFSIVGEMCEAIVDVLGNFSGMSQMMTPENIEATKSFMTALKDKEITEETLASAVRIAADQFKMPESEIIEGQRQRIAEQQTQLQEKEAEIQDLRKWRKEHEARNVKADKPTTEGTKGTARKTARKSIKKDND